MSDARVPDTRASDTRASSTVARIPFELPIGVVFAAVLMGYAVWAAFTGTGRFLPVRVGYGVDSAYYIGAAKAPLWSWKFLATPQGAPFLFPLLAKICLRNLRAIVLVQSAFAAGAWLYLANTVATRMREPAARTFAFVMILLLGAGPPVVFWNVSIATESLAISLLCLAIALWIRLVAGAAGRREFVAFAVVLAALACTRDSYAVVLVIVAGIALLVGLLRRAMRRRGAVIAAVCLVAALVNVGLSNHAGRWFDPLNETIGARLLGSHEATDYLRDHGMPYDKYVRNLHVKNMILVLPYNVTYGKEYKPYRDWLNHHGRTTYTMFLVTHPVWVIDEGFRDRQRVETPNLRDYGRTYFIEPRGAWLVVGKVGFPEVRTLIDVWICGALVAGVWLWRRRRDRPLLLATGVIALLVVPHFLVAWHGDALELDRHIISAAVQLRVCLVIVLAMLVDALLSAKWFDPIMRRRKELSTSGSELRTKPPKAAESTPTPG